MHNKRNSGFTLVELVVVIAVLAILAGVGAVAYNGYIDYAHRASDEELLAAVNTAFAAACEDRGVDRMSLKADSVSLDPATGDAKSPIKGIKTISALKDTDAVTGFQNAFASYFEGNTSKKLEYYDFDEIKFAGGKLMFTGDKSAYDKAKAEAAKNAFKNSNFSTDIEGLIKNVEGVTALFSSFVGEPGDGTLEERLNALSILHVDPVSTVATLKEQYGITDESSGTELANAMVLHVAHLTNSTDTDALADAIAAGEVPPDQSIVVLPMMLGMCTAYYHSEYATPDFKAKYEDAMADSSPTALLGLAMGGVTGDGGYAAYSASEDFRNDMNGYTGALTLVDQNSDAVDLTDPNAFSNDDFMALIRSILGE